MAACAAWAHSLTDLALHQPSMHSFINDVCVLICLLPLARFRIQPFQSTKLACSQARKFWNWEEMEEYDKKRWWILHAFMKKWRENSRIPKLKHKIFSLTPFNFIRLVCMCMCMCVFLCSFFYIFIPFSSFLFFHSILLSCNCGHDLVCLIGA